MDSPRMVKNTLKPPNFSSMSIKALKKGKRFADVK